MSDTVSLLKTVPDHICSSLTDDQKKFFFTVGFNFCFGLICSSLVTLVAKYKEVSGNE